MTKEEVLAKYNQPVEVCEGITIHYKDGNLWLNAHTPEVSLTVEGQQFITEYKKQVLSELAVAE